MSRADRAYPIHPSQLVVGLYVWVDMPWLEHPFLRSKLMLDTQAEVDEVRGAGAEGCLYWYPGRSRATPLPRPETPAPVVVAESPADAERAAATRRERELNQLKQLTQVARKSWENMSMAVWTVVHDMPRSPVSLGNKLSTIAFEVVESISNASVWQLRKLADSNARGQHHHALRTMTMSTMIGLQLGMSRQELHALSLAALVHDSGHVDAPYAKALPVRARFGSAASEATAAFDRERIQEHVELGVKLARMTGVFSPEALRIVAQHHVAMDGSGWPQNTKDVCMGARVLALADRFDRLCSPASRDEPPMSPSNAILQIFHHERARYDPAVMQAFIKLMGMYPPSTILRLTDGSIAMVLAPGASVHQPLIVIYDGSVLPQEAQTRILAVPGTPAVVSTVNIVGLPTHVIEWLEKIELRMAASPVALLQRQDEEQASEFETQAA